MEAIVTADIVGVAQPYAAFATPVFDVDGFPWEDDQPNRYLIYSK